MAGPLRLWTLAVVLRETQTSASAAMIQFCIERQCSGV